MTQDKEHKELNIGDQVFQPYKTTTIIFTLHK
jgi:hypothetical protein